MRWLEERADALPLRLDPEPFEDELFDELLVRELPLRELLLPRDLLLVLRPLRDLVLLEAFGDPPFDR